MTSTEAFQKYPDIYDTVEERDKNKWSKENTNPRYRDFKQIHFTAGDEEQFEEYRSKDSINIFRSNIDEKDISSNVFKDITTFEDCEIYNNLSPNDITNTFRYIFHKFKKGIFVQIIDNELKVFLPFSKNKFINEWSNRIKVDRRYKNMTDFLRHINSMENRKFNPKYVNKFTNSWYANNSLLRTEFPISENDSNNSVFKNLLEELCKTRKLPNIEFFINRRDFPILKKGHTEPYNNIWDTEDKKLVSHKYEKYCPIFSMSKRDGYADQLCPTWEEWVRVKNFEGKWFRETAGNYSKDFNTKWEDKIATAVFRGSSTGVGVDIQTNPRLKISYMSSKNLKDEDGLRYLDAGITKWQLRPRKIQGIKHLKTIEIDKLGFGLVDKLTPLEQSKYKYIIHIEGHVSAFRLSQEMNMGSLLLIVKSKWYIWYQHLLEPYIHYIPIKSDLSDIYEKIKWCKENDEQCKKIVENCRLFYKKYLCKDSILDYFQKLLYETKESVGKYFYNYISPKDLQILKEKHFLRSNLDTGIDAKLYVLKEVIKDYDMKSIELLINFLGRNELKIYKTFDTIFSNKLSIIKKCIVPNIRDVRMVVKQTDDIKKIKEQIHEYFVSTLCINDMRKYIPNLLYNFGNIQEDENNLLFSEYIEGVVLLEYLRSHEFNLQDFTSILLQIILTLEMCQEKFCFTHNDLTPWNIIIKKQEKDIYYNIGNKTYKIRAKVVPVIIDFGKSHIVYNNKHYGFINIYKTSRVIDILTLIIKCIDILVEKNFNNNVCLNLMNFFTNNRYIPHKFTDIYNLKKFIYEHGKYVNLLAEEKYDLENIRPIDFFVYLRENSLFKRYVDEILTVRCKVKYRPYKVSSSYLFYNFFQSLEESDIVKKTLIHITRSENTNNLSRLVKSYMELQILLKLKPKYDKDISDAMRNIEDEIFKSITKINLPDSIINYTEFTNIIKDENMYNITFLTTLFEDIEKLEKFDYTKINSYLNLLWNHINVENSYNINFNKSYDKHISNIEKEFNTIKDHCIYKHNIGNYETLKKTLISIIIININYLKDKVFEETFSIYKKILDKYNIKI